MLRAALAAALAPSALSQAAKARKMQVASGKRKQRGSSFSPGSLLAPVPGASPSWCWGLRAPVQPNAVPEGLHLHLALLNKTAETKPESAFTAGAARQQKQQHNVGSVAPPLRRVWGTRPSGSSSKVTSSSE